MTIGLLNLSHFLLTTKQKVVAVEPYIVEAMQMYTAHISREIRRKQMAEQLILLTIVMYIIPYSIQIG
ncbi:hypothetical protein TL18_06530 [Methanobrevibacter sp. YE315]|nr:hypothetical protein TL18_06530 [Methanobrevibacter sp. YE315]